jgi:hypothetical protein
VFNKCPGQDVRRIQSESIPCPHCQYKIEFFSDEMKRTCPQCKVTVSKDALPSCVQWCKAARQCIGEERWNKLNNKEA